MTTSWLYQGFQYASRLASVAEQRQIQRRLLQNIVSTERLDLILSVGCGFGEELEEIFQEIKAGDSNPNIWAIDCVDVGSHLRKMHLAAKLGSRFHWQQLDLLNMNRLADYGHFDLIQCGFVLHDVDWDNKEWAYRMLARSLRPRGRLLLSDIFLKHPFSREQPDAGRYKREVRIVYNGFISEANEARQKNILTSDEWRDLVGDGNGPGLKNTRSEAVKGSRDFFETLQQTIARLGDAGFDIDTTFANPINSRLAVILARRE